MKYLTRQEELILLTIFRLKGKSYLIEIREHLIKHTEKKWSLSSVYVPLDRLRRDGYLDTVLGNPEPKRGGKAIKYYQLTKKSLTALEEVKNIHDVMWDGITKLADGGLI